MPDPNIDAAAAEAATDAAERWFKWSCELRAAIEYVYLSLVNPFVYKSYKYLNKIM